MDSVKRTETERVRKQKYRHKFKPPVSNKTFSDEPQELLGYEVEFPDDCIKHALDIYLKVVPMEEDEDVGEILACQQVVPERRKGKKCQLCWRRDKKLHISPFMKHGDFCFAPLSDDSESCYD